MAPKKAVLRTSTRLTPFLRGVIYGMFLAGSTYQEIAEEVVKSDGHKPCQQTVASVVAQAEENGGLCWNGLAGSATSETVGRPRATTGALDKKIVRLVFRHRGKSSVTVRFLKKLLPEARKFSDATLLRRLEEAGLAYLRRRRKALVPAEYKATRLDWADWVLSRTRATLRRWAFTDGTVFYLARSVTEKASSARGALGPYVWRQSSGSDALYHECVGPSSYWKAQGLPIRVWGLLIAGCLFIHVLPEGERMNIGYYEWLVRSVFPRWIGKAMGDWSSGIFLVQDHEKCLWNARPRAAMREAGIHLLEDFPKCSQDLNPIETAWRELRARLAATEPADRESRGDFIVRLRNAVAWVNSSRKPYLKYLCSSQKERAKDVKTQKGARTKH